jgi:26S proteasome regulatory subunit T2
MEEFIQNQEHLKLETAREEKNEEDRSRVDDLRGTPMLVGTIVSMTSGPEFYV